MASDFDAFEGLKIAKTDVETLMQKGKTYGNSWKKRGGVDSYMMLCRKWDRIEEQVSKAGYNILEALVAEGDVRDGLLDDVRDLRCYLLLVEEEVQRRLRAAQGAKRPALALDPQQPTAEPEISGAEPPPHGYVDQG